MPGYLPKQRPPTVQKQSQQFRLGINQPGNRARDSPARPVQSYPREYLPKDDDLHPGFSLSARSGGAMTGSQPFVGRYSASLLQKPCSGPPPKCQPEDFRHHAYARAAADASSLYQIRPPRRPSTSSASKISASYEHLSDHVQPNILRQTANAYGHSSGRPFRRPPMLSPPQSVSSPSVAMQRNPRKLVKRGVAEARGDSSWQRAWRTILGIKRVRSWDSYSYSTI